MWKSIREQIKASKDIITSFLKINSNLKIVVLWFCLFLPSYG